MSVASRRIAFAILALSLAACSTTPSPSPAPTARTYPDLGIANSTTIALTLVVNGVVLETVPPGVSQDPVPVAMPSLPWQVEVRSPSGRLLTSLTVTASTHVDATTGVDTGVFLPCGLIDLWSGPVPTGPVPRPSGPADGCS